MKPEEEDQAAMQLIDVRKGKSRPKFFKFDLAPDEENGQKSQAEIRAAAMREQ